MMRTVERGTDEVVHRRVRDDKALGAVLLGVEHPRNNSAGLRDEEAAGLEQQVHTKAVKRRTDGARVLGNAFSGIEWRAAVLDAEAAAGIEVLDIDAVGAQVFDERADALHGFRKRCGVADL